MENNGVLIIGIMGAILSPLISAFGLYLQYRKEQKVLENAKKVEESNAVKVKAEAEKIEAEAKVLEIKSNIETVNYYIGMVTALRTEVNALTELSRKNGGEIAVLTARLKAADGEKEKLAKDNAELVKEVQELRVEVAILREQQKTKGE